MTTDHANSPCEQGQHFPGWPCFVSSPASLPRPRSRTWNGARESTRARSYQLLTLTTVRTERLTGKSEARMWLLSLA